MRTGSSSFVQIATCPACKAELLGTYLVAWVGWRASGGRGKPMTFHDFGSMLTSASTSTSWAHTTITHRQGHPPLFVRDDHSHRRSWDRARGRAGNGSSNAHARVRVSWPRLVAIWCPAVCWKNVCTSSGVHAQVCACDARLTGVRAAMSMTKRRESVAFLASVACVPRHASPSGYGAIESQPPI